MTIAVMAEVQCVDGSVLSILPVPRLDRRGVAYEVTLRLLVDGAPFGDVGECSGWRLARAAEQLRQAQAADGPEAFGVTGVDLLLDARLGRGAGSDGADGALPDPAASALRRLLPRDRELLSLRSRDPDDVAGTGELRVWLRDDRSWVPASDGARGRWSTRSRAVLDCWGDGGRGVRCLLDAPGLLRLLDGLVADRAAVAGRPAVV
jgi:hypothetical protein